MAESKRYVIDTNVIVSALLIHGSTARKAFNIARARGSILLSFEVVQELFEVLSRPIFDRYIDEDDRLEFLTLFVKEATLVEVVEQIAECRDPRDDKFLELAVSGKADTLISGDAELQSLNPFRGITILSPREFLEAMG